MSSKLIISAEYGKIDTSFYKIFYI